MLIKKAGNSYYKTLHAYVTIYDLDNEKSIIITHYKDNSIVSIRLADWKDMSNSYFRADGLVYLENICKDDENELLDTEKLLSYDNMFSEVC